MCESAYTLALGLFALGRVFLLKVTHQSFFAFALVPYRARDPNFPNKPPARAVFNPALGRGVCEMLQRVVLCGVRGDWSSAQEWCGGAAQVQKLGAMYRGGINVALAGAVVQYYNAVICVGKQDWAQAQTLLEECAEQLAFTMPDCAAAVWLARARVAFFLHDASGALWACQKCDGLLQDMVSPASEILAPLLAAEYTRINFYY